MAARTMDKTAQTFVRSVPQTPAEGLKEVLKAGLIAGGGGAVAAAIIHEIRRRSDEGRRKKLFQSLIESDSPVVRLDPSVSDTEAEEKIMHAGEDVPGEISKVAAADQAQADVDAFVNGGGRHPGISTASEVVTAPGRAGLHVVADVVKSGADAVPGMSALSDYMSDPTKQPWTPAATIAAALAAAYGGYKGMDALMDRSETGDQESDYVRKRNLYQQKVLEALQRKYGNTEKTAELCRTAAKMAGLPDEGLRDADLQKQSSVDAQRARDPDMMFLGTVGALASAGLGGLSFVLSKRYFDKKNEARQRFKQIEREIRQKYLLDQSPVLVDADMSFLDRQPDEKALEEGKRRKAEAVRTTVNAAPIAGEVAGIVEEPRESLQQESLKTMAKSEDTTPVLA